MQAKLDVMVAMFCYAGNGGVRMVYHELVSWFAKTYHQMLSDERIGRVRVMYPGDVPLTMERNRVVATAIEGGYDAIWMLDNDNIPDLYAGKQPDARPFWESSFDFLYDRTLQGVPTAVVAPYCGPPPHPTGGGEENVYVFQFVNVETDGDPAQVKLEPYGRSEAALMAGIQPCAAGPTGCVLYSTSALQLLPVRRETQADILEQFRGGQIDQQTALRRLNMQSWFFYEFTDQQQAHKASTEDVTNLREICMAGWQQLRQDVLFCNWDSWAGHCKPKVVGKPTVVHSDTVSNVFAEAVLSGPRSGERLVEVHFDSPNDELLIDEAISEEYSPSSDETTETGPGAPVSAVRIGEISCQAVGDSLEDWQYLQAFVRNMARENPDRDLRILDVGAWDGQAALAMAQGLNQGTVYCVEDWLGWDGIDPEQMESIFAANATKGPLRLIREPWHDFLGGLEPQNADVLLLDRLPQHAYTTNLLRLAVSHLRADGILLGLDCEAASKPLERVFLSQGVDVATVERRGVWMVRMADVVAAVSVKEVAGD